MSWLLIQEWFKLVWQKCFWLSSKRLFTCSGTVWRLYALCVVFVIMWGITFGSSLASLSRWWIPGFVPLYGSLVKFRRHSKQIYCCWWLKISQSLIQSGNITCSPAGIVTVWETSTRHAQVSYLISLYYTATLSIRTTTCFQQIITEGRR